MQRNFFPCAAVIGSVFFAFASCKKIPAAPQTEPKTILLSKNSWQLQKDEIQTDSGPVTDLMTGRPACRKDDLTVFKPDNSMEVNEGTTKCDALHPQIISVSTWNFSDNETKLQLGGGITYNIEKLENNNLVLFYSYSNGSSVSKRRLTYLR
jgi:hypothetical protein